MGAEPPEQQQTMSAKSILKEQVLYPEFFACLFCAQKSELDGRTNGIPRLQNSAVNSAALQSVTSAIDDTGVRMHGLAYTPGMFGDTLVDTVLAPVRRFFAEYPHGETYVMRMDIGIFMPPPKRAAQAEHTSSIVAEMERNNVAPINWAPGDPVPMMINFGVPLPHWTAVRANRTLFRHACNQLMLLIQKLYKPPRGCRLILDYNEPGTSSGIDDLDLWMDEGNERIVCSAFARRTIDAARARYREQRVSAWHADADRLVYALAQAGHIKIAPVCIETSLDTDTLYMPFALHSAAHNCGEADAGCLFWIDALQSDRLHITLTGVRRAAHGDELVAGGGAATGAAATGGASVPMTVAARRELARRILERDPDAVVLIDDPSSYMARYLTYAAEFGDPRFRDCAGARAAAGAALVVSIDSDFFALVLLWYAQFCARQGAERRDYCRTHAPFLSLGAVRASRAGWITDAAQLLTKAAVDKLPPAEAERIKQYFAIWDIDRLYERITAPPAAAAATRGTSPLSAAAVDGSLAAAAAAAAPGAAGDRSPLEQVAAFATFCSLCKNDYLPGFTGINRKFAYAAFQSLTRPLVVTARCAALVIDLTAMIELVKRAYYNALVSQPGPIGKQAKTRPVAQLAYKTVANWVADKNKKRLDYHMPTAEHLQDLHEKAQWWLSMALRAWQDIGQILNHRQWGWRTLE